MVEGLNVESTKLTAAVAGSAEIPRNSATEELVKSEPVVTLLPDIYGRLALIAELKRSATVEEEAEGKALGDGGGED